ncbi:hypothetical protein [Hyphomonas sp.]|uniref:hypothetical protein n=1 Tax=Hyphomonas sp. TaxID=87 RepID=UPI00391AB85E
MKTGNRILCLVIALGTAGAAHADPSKAPTENVYACVSISEDSARLACFDAAVAELRTKEQSGQIQTIDVAQIKEIEKEAFGFSMPSLPALFNRSSSSAQAAPNAESIEEITAAVKSARIQGVTGRAIVVLENGQTWEQIDTTKLNAMNLRKATQASVRKAALGSFMMKVDGSKAFRVKRVS